MPLTKWFLAIYLATSLKKGISSVQLAKYAGVTQTTSWFMLQRIRFALEENNGDILGGEVEIDETYVAGKGDTRKSIVFGAIERGGRIKLSHVQSSGSRVLLPKIRDEIQRGSTIYSDKWQAYPTLRWRGYKHYTVNHSQMQFVSGVIHTQNIEGAWSHFKRSLIGVYHQVSVKHLQKYCSEFEYRYNTRHMKDYERFDA